MAANTLNDDRMFTELGLFTYLGSKSFQILLGKYPLQFSCYNSFNIVCICFREEDLTELEKTGSLYQAGLDKQGRPVIVFIGEFYLLIFMFFNCFPFSMVGKEFVVGSTSPLFSSKLIALFFYRKSL
jgi:hypothetical protein